MSTLDLHTWHWDTQLEGIGFLIVLVTVPLIWLLVTSLRWWLADRHRDG
jgi:hypothetical protein